MLQRVPEGGERLKKCRAPDRLVPGEFDVHETRTRGQRRGQEELPLVRRWSRNVAQFQSSARGPSVRGTSPGISSSRTERHSRSWRVSGRSRHRTCPGSPATNAWPVARVGITTQYSCCCRWSQPGSDPRGGPTRARWAGRQPCSDP